MGIDAVSEGERKKEERESEKRGESFDFFSAMVRWEWIDNCRRPLPNHQTHAIR